MRVLHRSMHEGVLQKLVQNSLPALRCHVVYAYTSSSLVCTKSHIPSQGASFLLAC
jgi:hypothetical protein